MIIKFVYTQLWYWISNSLTYTEYNIGVFVSKEITCFEIKVIGSNHESYNVEITVYICDINWNLYSLSSGSSVFFWKKEIYHNRI